jgi:histidinol dehydrogenase
MTIGTVTNHRNREEGAIVYPVYSRRSGGLSIGVNLFPNRKVCSFNCPYCEVFPFEADVFFSMETMKTALCRTIQEAQKNGIPIKDICFSGNGEPTMSPFFTEAVTAAAAVRAELAPEAKLVAITNGTGLLNQAVFQFLKTASLPGIDLHIWLKLDAATEAWYWAVDRSAVPFMELVSRIRDFAGSGAPFTIQTMLCKIKSALPPPEESAAWVQLVTELAAISAASVGDCCAVGHTGATGGCCAAENKPHIRAVQLYGKARPAPEDPLAEAAPTAALEERAALLREALDKAGMIVPVEVYK